ncbi:MAG: bifunctional [glutamate--ammonia ligase]-adenylyl-L-tyrosine phosphorylase/[glutamate--ammonia-ligase] adenylyltransferase [Xanthomonadaceae bacterium]|nr:bifunctional [glutamate--ammonia ligase]-adenylyl-L-tyrosine phosphorylase/[glutamate--ammonia-ligase] adenylyltransferase [Xanthomonadaceae bacterium]
MSDIDLKSRVLAASPFIAGVFRRQPEWADAAWSSDEFAGSLPPVAERLTAALDGLGDEAALMRALRRFRNRELARIAVRDIAGFAELDETLADLSALADAAIDAAMAFVAAGLQARHGRPREAGGSLATPFVLGMGKLGGRELNFSSDIDLIVGYTANGETDGPRGISNEEYFARLARDSARLLATPTEDGFVFRVDTLLRPFGSVGPHAASMSGMEDYYQTHGREWERYALVKARACAGDRAAGQRLLDHLRPFVYRRYLDYGAINSLRELKGLIDRDAQAKGAADNLKLGPGGIREVEFIVQLFQLTRGGQDARLRDARLRPVLRYIGSSGLLPADTARALDEAYVLLRRAENAVQLHGDLQTHKLPADDASRAAFAAALGAADYEAALAPIRRARDFVRREFERLFAEAETPAATPAFDAGANEAWDAGVESEAALTARGFGTGTGSGTGTAAVAKALADLRQSRLMRTLSDASLARLRSLLPLLLDEAARQPDPSTAAVRALDVIAAILGRSPYLVLLRDSSVARAQLVRLCAASPWLTALLARTPALLDALLDPRLAAETPTRQQLHDELGTRFERIAADDMEAQMELLRRYRQEMTLRIAACDLSGSLPLVQVSDRLTWLAEAILERTVAAARAQLADAHGAPVNADGSAASFAILGYGKFGSIELGYGSDLDLVFVYDCDQPDAPTTGTKPISNAQFFARLGQRIVHYLATHTPAGRAYEVDLQLRPSGNSGMVVSGLASFARYQRDSAWTWEHQAFLRARTVVGDAALCAAIAALRRDVLMRVRDADGLRREVVDMRAKMRSNLEKRAPGKWDVKQAEGGLIDAEFLTQFLVLRDAHGHASLVEYTDNWRQLEALADACRITLSQKDDLLRATRAYRGWLHRRALQQADGLADQADFAAERAAVAALWQELVLGEAT